jgi:hypothetical protein
VNLNTFDDMIMMLELEEYTILRNLYLRYKQKEIYVILIIFLNTKLNFNIKNKTDLHWLNAGGHQPLRNPSNLFKQPNKLLQESNCPSRPCSAHFCNWKHGVQRNVFKKKESVHLHIGRVWRREDRKHQAHSSVLGCRQWKALLD